MTLALIYIRQSKESERSVSPETQEAACRKLQPVTESDSVLVLRDLGVSGGKPPEKRPGFLALRDRIAASDRTHEPLVVATYDQSRLSRSNVDSAVFFAFLEPRSWVSLVMVDGHFDRSPSGEFTWAMMAATATHLRKITGKKIREAYAQLNAKGAATGPAPLATGALARALTATWRSTRRQLRSSAVPFRNTPPAIGAHVASRTDSTRRARSSQAPKAGMPTPWDSFSRMWPTSV